MKMYLLAPQTRANDDSDAAITAATDETGRIIAGLIVDALRHGGDTSHHGLWVAADPWDAVRGPDGNVARLSFGAVHATPLEDADRLRSWIMTAIDPAQGHGCEVRSLINCRSVSFGYDGQAFLSLRADDPPPVAPGPLILVQDCAALLSASDYQDGLLPIR